MKKVKQTAEQHALKMEVSSRSTYDESALFDEDDADEIVLGRTNDLEEEKKETSKQRLISQAKLKPEFQGLRSTPSGHKIQDIRELMTVPVSWQLYCMCESYLSNGTLRLLSLRISPRVLL